jgi:glycine/D-amino acid oxidase-like deaminating enzyme
MRPTHSNNLVIGSAGARNDQYQCHVDYNAAALQIRRLCNLLPWLKELSIIRAFAGITEYTPDKEPYIGAVPGVSGLYIAAGFAGEGFCPGPLTGKILAEMICGIEPSISLEPFRPDRFATTINEGKTPPDVFYPLDKLLLAWEAVEKFNPELND